MSILAIAGLGITLGVQIMKDGKHQKVLFLSILAVFLFITTSSLILSLLNL
jgi:hypothetical protein